MSPSRNDTPPPIRPFADFLREQGKGHSHEELSEGLRDLVGRVKDTGKKGSITYVVTVEPTKGTDALTVSDEIKLRFPEHDRDASLFFSDANGNLTRSDPNQLTFESLREVPPPPGVDATTGEITTAYKGA
jgi:hypothetical protein